MKQSIYRLRNLEDFRFYVYGVDDVNIIKAVKNVIETEMSIVAKMDNKDY